MARKIGITWKMYALLVIFVALIVTCLWFFQSKMLTYFYQMTRYNEVEAAESAMATVLSNNERLTAVAVEYAENYHIDIWVYRIENGSVAKPIVTVSGTGQDEISNISHKFEVLYGKAAQNEGSYIAIVPTANFLDGTDVSVIRDNDGTSGMLPVTYYRGEKSSAISVSLRDLEDGRRFMIIQMTNITPDSTMVHTLRDQSMWIGVFLGLAALGLAFLMSRLITKPIVHMNESAKRLANGEYNANFEGHGYREISELADTLNYASNELAKTDHLQKELISNISHDLRTPLTMIKGYGEVMRDIPDENTAENIQIIIDETSRLSDLVNDMLDLSKIHAGTRNPMFTRFCLTDTVRDTLQRYERLIHQDGYRIEFESDCEVDVYADRGMILQVLYNLINNAINYSGDEKYVTVRQEVSEDTVRITVTDRGEGIPEDQLSLIWDRYYKVDKVHRRATVGSGLGLSIVKGILELHHAAYGVQSILGKGSTFWFDLRQAENESLYDTSKGYIEADYEKQKTEE